MGDSVRWRDVGIADSYTEFRWDEDAERDYLVRTTIVLQQHSETGERRYNTFTAEEATVDE